jgi:arylsulfatase A-like enzyme
VPDESSVARPSTIFIVADDLGSADLGCYGGTNISPVLDRLAREGLLFTRAYSNSPVCSPARFAMMTGRWQYRLPGAADEPLTGRRSTILGLPPEHPTLPSLLRESGYATALIGKWHLGSLPKFGPLLSGYDEFFGPMGGGVDYFSHVNFSGKRDLWEGSEESKAHGYLTDLIAQRAAEYVARPRENPFFLSVHFTAPHWPWETRDDAVESQRIGANIAHLDGGSVETYLKMISHMDEGIGLIVDAVPARQRDNTLIVFISDNGGERFSNNWPFVGGKMDLLEGGIRIPQIAWWAGGIKPGSRSAFPTLTMDWMSTMLDVAGLQAHPNHPLDGISLRPVFTDERWLPQRDLHWRMKHRQQAATVSGNWKYLRVDGHEYLFDVITDGRERANLAGRYPERLGALRDRWHAWAKTMPGIPDDAFSHLLWDEKDMPRSTF